MMNKEEQQLEEMRTQLEQQPVPEQALDEAILTGFDKARIKRRKQRRTIWLSVAVAVLLFGFVTTVRVSPAFANAMASIPGFSAIIEMIQSDKGINDIVENDYFEELNLSAVHDDLTFTLDGAIADESGMILSYTIEKTDDSQEFTLKGVDIYQNGKRLEASWSYSGFNSGSDNQVKDTIIVASTSSLNYDDPNFELKVTIDYKEQTTFQLPFTLKKEIKKSISYPLEQTVDIDGQKLIIHELKISPLRATLTLSPAEENTMQLLRIEHIQLTDEHGEVWGAIKNGPSGFGGSYDEIRTFFIQSNYFRTPKEIHIQLDRIQALPKGENFIEIDFNKKEVVSQPDNWPIKISDIGRKSFKAAISSNSVYSELFGNAFDANGQILEKTGSAYENGDLYVTFEPQYETTNAANPVKIYIDSYPNYLFSSASVKIELE